MSDYLDEVFGSAGVLSRRFSGYEPRKGQVDLARAVDRAISTEKHLLAEAPTGTGKSLAYAVPASYHAATHGGTAVIVTANIALQEQLVRKDLPLLAEVLPWKFRFTLLKGINNYLCLDKLHDLEPEDLLEPGAQEISSWAPETSTGDVSELPFQPTPALWRKFSVTSDECAGDECAYFNRCHGLRPRREAAEADVVVTNYHMLFSHLKVLELTAGQVSILPSFKVAILDEGHKAVDIARDFFGFRLGEGAIKWVGEKLRGQHEVDLASEGAAFFSALLAYRRSSAYKTRLREAGPVPWQGLCSTLAEVSRVYERLAKKMVAFDAPPLSDRDKKAVRDLVRRGRRATEVADQIQAAMELSGEDVYFVEEEDGGRALLCSKPVTVAERLRQYLFSDRCSTAVTSATLAVRSSFEFVARDLGAEAASTLVAESPFRWAEQALLVTPEDVPEPNDRSFTEVVADRCARVIELACGRTLALFTSYKNLNAAYDRVSATTSYRVLRQGDMPRTRLIDEFRRDVHSVLLGTESFWAGVDVPGESLSCVLIDRLPFTTPDDPVMDVLSERDKEWFMRYSVPRAIIAFKQGFGRLIRTSTDRGVVVVLDRRITSKFYGRFFVDSLPPVARSRQLEDIAAFLDGRVVEPPVSKVAAQGRSLFDF